MTVKKESEYKISRRLFLKSGMVLAGAGMLAVACGPKVTPEPTSEEPASEEAPTEASPQGPQYELDEMRLMTWENFEEDPGFLKAWEVFTEKTGVKISPEHSPWSGFPDKIITLAAAGNLPDIFRVNGHMTSVFGYRDLLLKLNPFIEGEDYDMDMYYPLLRRIYQYPEGEQLCLPQDNANYASTYYNKKLFEEAGLDLPPDDWTYNDMLEYAEKLTKREGGRTTQYGMVLYSGGYPSPPVIAFGGQMSDDNFNPKQANIDSEEHRDLFQYVMDAIEAGIHPTIEATNDLGGATQALATGKVAIAAAEGLWVSNSLADATDLEWDILVSPRRSGKPHRFCTAGAGWGAPAASKDKDLAWDFLKYFMGPEGQEIVMSNRRVDYIWPSAIKALSEKEAQDKGAEFPNLIKTVNAAEDIIPWWALHPNVEQIWTTILSPISEEVVRKEKTIDEGLAEMDAKMQELLDNLPEK
jgi:multiple sugar transport system substrate-binding protein